MISPPQLRWLIFWCLFAAAGANARTDAPPLTERQRDADRMVFAPGEKVPFLGIFTHVEPRFDLGEKLASLRRAIAANPEIDGVTLKVRWRQFHPEKDRWEWEALEALIATAAEAGKLVNFALIPGAASPEWIFAEGVRRTAPVEFGRLKVSVPVPWDKTYMKLLTADLAELAARYGDDPRIFKIEVLGHNYNDSGEEMHAPSSEAMRPYGWTRDVVLENWRYWIDEYARLFPRKKLSLVISQMYRGGDEDLPGLVADYFAQKLAGRGILQTHQLNGRADVLAPSGEICRRLATLAPNCHETVQTFKERPERQGSALMTVYNARQMGDNLLYLQLWRRDSDDPAYARALRAAWDDYHTLSVPEMRARLEAEGHYRSGPSQP